MLDEHAEAIVHKALVLALQGDAPLRTFLTYLLRRPACESNATSPILSQLC